MPNPSIPEIEAIFRNAEQLRESGKQQEALKEYTRVVYFAPRHWPSWFHLGTLFGASGHHELAVSLLHRAETIKPDDRVIKNHLADHLIKLERVDEARLLLEASWALDSSQRNISAPFKIGKLLWEANNPVEAIPYFERVISDREEVGEVSEEIKHTIIIARWFRALCRMFLGDYQAAWEDYEIRNEIPGVIVPQLTGTKWSGQPVSGRTIFFAYEQRFGDIIQFIRFIPRLTAMGAKVTLQLPPELERQIRYSFPDIAVVSTNQSIPHYDYYQFITSIPAVLNLSKEDCFLDPVRYFGVDDKKTVVRLPMRNGTSLKVGLVWAGKPDPDRSIPLTQYIPLLKHQSVSFFSFQLGDKRKNMHEHAVGWLIHDLAPQITDFYDSSELLQQMDLLITVDTAIAHQAGALGIPVWLMLRYFSDWRWEVDREDNPWYPSMRLFRQDKPGSWITAGRQLESAFEEWVSLPVKTHKQISTGNR